MGVPRERWDKDRFARLYADEDSPEEVCKKIALRKSLSERMGDRLIKRKGVLDCCRASVTRCDRCRAPICVRHTWRCVESGCRHLVFCERHWEEHLARAH